MNYFINLPKIGFYSKNTSKFYDVPHFSRFIFIMYSYFYNSFHSTHCSEAICHTEGNVGEALEILFEKYYNVEKKENNQVDMKDCLQKRQEEKEALESIYGGFFNEKIKNRIWTIKLLLSYMVDKSEDKKKVQKPKLPQKDICRLYLQGKCHYGIKCRFIHQQPERVEKPKAKNEPYVTLEIRFPPGKFSNFQFSKIFGNFSCNRKI